MKEIKIIKYIVGMLAIILFVSCEDDVTLEFSDYDKKIVVEGKIIESEVPSVFLTWSSGYFDTLNIDIQRVYQLLESEDLTELESVFRSYLVLNAVVTVSDGNITDTLKLGINENVFPFIHYVGSGMLKGETGTQYTLNIKYFGDELSAITSIPEAVPLDSLWFEFRSEDDDSLGYIHGIFDDPTEIGNNYRVFSKTENRDSIFVHPWNSVWNDRNINGEEDVKFILYHGANTTDDQEDRERWFFKLGETVTVRLCAMDNDHYQFWYSFEQNAGGGGNPFASPAQIATNINGGLGVWGGYGIFDMEYKVVYIEPTDDE